MMADWERLQQHLEPSQATPEFKADLEAWGRGREGTRVQVVGWLPQVKVIRVLTQLLAAYPHEPIEAVTLKGVSG